MIHLRQLVGVSLLLCSMRGMARADTDNGPLTPPAIDPSDTLAPVTILEGPGVRVGEGTVIHPQVGIETGYVSNVFYDSQNPTGAGLLRLIVEAGTSSLSAQRLAVSPGEGTTNQTGPNLDKGAFQFDANAYVTYDQYLSGNNDVQSQGGTGGGLLLRGVVNPSRPVSFSALDLYNRVIRPTNFESNADTNRDVNTLTLRLNYIPPGRALDGYIHYTDVIDVFEANNQQFADRFQNQLGVRVDYKFLPLTLAYVDVSEGVFTGLGSSSTKVTSFPLVAVVGIQTALTVNTSLLARVGYTHGFYESGPDYSTVVGGLQLAWRFSELGKATLLYSYDHQDSINANFYGEHYIQGVVEEDYAPFVVFATPQIRFREYEGITEPIMGGASTRDDTIIAVTAGIRYSFRDWLGGALEYTFTSDQTNYRYNTGDNPMYDPSYVRHQLLLGIRASY